MHKREQRKLQQDKLVFASKTTPDNFRVVCEKDSAMMSGVVTDSDLTVTLRHGANGSSGGYDNPVCNVNDEVDERRRFSVEGLYPQTMSIVKEMPALHLEHCKL